jgi:hypothetical protein
MSYFFDSFSQLQSGKQAWSFGEAEDQMRFEVRSGDLRVGDPTSKERSEIRDLNRFDFGHTYTADYSFMIEPGAVNTSKWLMISQIHQTEDLGEGSFSPIFDLALRGERLAIEVRSTTAKMTTSDPTTKTIFVDDENIVRGQWYHVSLEVKVDPFGHGLVNAWLDDQQVAHYEGAVGYNDVKGPYWKMGVYRAEANETLAVNFKDFVLVEGFRATALPEVASVIEQHSLLPAASLLTGMPIAKHPAATSMADAHTTTPVVNPYEPVVNPYEGLLDMQTAPSAFGHGKVAAMATDWWY